MKAIKILSFFSLIIAIFFTISCDKARLETKSNLMLTMHDTAGNYANVFVEIIDAEVKLSDSLGNETWLPLEINAGIYDLLEFQNGIDTVLADSTALPAGMLEELRLKLGNQNTVVLAESGDTIALATPSAEQSGLKIKIHENLEPNVNYNLIIDFNVYKSIVMKGNGGFSLKPVIKVDSLVQI